MKHAYLPRVDRALLRDVERKAVQAALIELKRTLKASGKPSSDADIGQLIGCSQQAISKAIRRAEVGPGVARNLCDYLATELGELVRRYAPDAAQAVARVPASAVPRGARDVMRLPKYGAADMPYLEFLAAMQASEMPAPLWERFFDEALAVIRNAEERRQLDELRAASAIAKRSRK